MRQRASGVPLRVALLSPCYWPEVRRGTERFARDLADGLLARGHAPTLITSHRGLPRRDEESGLPVLRLPRPPHRFLVGRRYESYVTHVPFSYLALRSSTYDVAHALYPSDALAAARWGRRTGGPAILSYMGVPQPEWLGARRGRREILERAVADCDAVVTLSQHAVRVFRTALGEDVEVIAPGVDLRAFRRSAPRTREPTIVCPAAIDEPRKNVRLLIDAFALVRRRYPAAQLVLSRPRRPAGLSTAPGVQWRELDEREALARAYSEAWVAVLPSVGEAFGLVLAEALACGTPVVGHADAAIPEIIDRPEIGQLFERLDPDVLARVILETLDLARSEETVAACRQRALEFSVERCTEQYLALYHRLLRHRARAVHITPEPHEPTPV